MVSIKNHEDQTEVQAFLYVNGGGRYHWTGLNDLGHQNTWIWDGDGSRAEYTNWAPGEPSGKDEYNRDEDCVIIDVAENYFKWNDAMCLHSFSVLCEK